MTLAAWDYLEKPCPVCGKTMEYLGFWADGLRWYKCKMHTNYYYKP